MSREFEMPVASVFYMPGQGMVLAGSVRRGVIAIGDRVTVASPLAAKTAVVAGLERLGTRELIDTANPDDEIAILCRDVEVEDVPDGLERVDQYAWKVLDLTVRSLESAPSRWWKRIFPGSEG